MPVKRVVCLANSRKLVERCVAGREWIEGRGAGDWVRLVSDRETQGVSAYERQYEDGSDPQVLDIIDIPLLEPRPRDHQTENWLLDPVCYWEKAGRLSSFDLPALPSGSTDSAPTKAGTTRSRSRQSTQSPIHCD